MEKFLFEVRNKAQEYFSILENKIFYSDFLSSDSIIYIFYLKNY